MEQVTNEGPGLMTAAQRDDLALATYVQLSRIYDVLLFQCKNIDGIDELIESHRSGHLFGPEPNLVEPEDV